MEFNNYFQPGKKTLENNKRINNQIGNYLASLKEQESRHEEEKRKDMLAESSARFAYASGIARSKSRVRNLEEQIKYSDKVAVIGMTKVMTKLVENSLLLDEEEFAKINPNYKNLIEETCRGFLENADINENITNKLTLSLMENVIRKAPKVEIGKLLTEEQISQEMEDEEQDPKEVDAAIKKLSNNVKKKIAKIIGKEQKKTQEIQNDIDNLVAMSQAVVPAPAEDVSVDENGNPVEEVPQEEAPVQEEAAAEEVPVDENGNPVEDVSQEGVEGQGGRQIHIDPDGTTSILVPTGQLALNPDGSMDINLQEKVIVHETPRSGLLETLAVNEALNMIKEGKEYNSDLAIGNSLIYLTILEAFNESGLMTVTENDYTNIVKKAGGSIETANQNIQKEAIVDMKKAKEAPKKVEEKEPRKDEEMTEEELTVKLEKEGFDFSVDNFKEIAFEQGYRLNKDTGMYYKK